jgi:ATP-dependent DNA helicase RecG
VDELGSGIQNTYKYCGLYTPGSNPEFIEGDVFKTSIPIQTGKVSGEVSGEVQKIVRALDDVMKRSELQQKNQG